MDNATAAVARPTLTRRQLVAAAATAAAASWLVTNAPWLGSSTLGGDLLGDIPLSVGYLLGSDRGPLERLPDAGRVVPAAGLASGDAALTGPARVRIHGMTGGVDADLHQAWVDAMFASPQRGGEPLPFYAWTYDRGSRGGGGVSFVADVGAAPTLALTLGVARGSNETDRRDTTSTALFATGRGADIAKLHTGFYLLGLQPQTWNRGGTLVPAEDPRWRRQASVVVSVAPAGPR